MAAEKDRRYGHNCLDWIIRPGRRELVLFTSHVTGQRVDGCGVAGNQSGNLKVYSCLISKEIPHADFGVGGREHS